MAVVSAARNRSVTAARSKASATTSTQSSTRLPAIHPALLPVVQRQQFEKLVTDALASIPRRFRDAMSNIAIVVEDEPDPALLAEMDVEPGGTLLGLYQGIPLTERRWDYGNALPDRILLFQGPHERQSDDHEDLVVAIGETLIHEIGHYFGLSEEEIEAIEEQYWNDRA
jgi:predicted Zn-dependent protease with MMP-like domain